MRRASGSVARRSPAEPYDADLRPTDGGRVSTGKPIDATTDNDDRKAQLETLRADRRARAQVRKDPLPGAATGASS
jgi:hypothetical protein